MTLVDCVKEPPATLLPGSFDFSTHSSRVDEPASLESMGEAALVAAAFLLLADAGRTG